MVVRLYDKKAEQLQKENYPNHQFNGNAVDQAGAMGWGLMSVLQENHIAGETELYFEKGWSWYDANGKAWLGIRRASYVRMDNRNVGPYTNLGWRGSLRVNFVN